MPCEYYFDYSKNFYNKITELLEHFDIDVEESFSTDHMYGLKEFVTSNIVIFELNKKTGNIFISYYNSSHNNLWDEIITTLIIEELQTIIRINHLKSSIKNILRKSIERCLIS